MDTGILTQHPIFKKYIAEVVDFTGEGIEDENGHGCLVTFLYLLSGNRPLTPQEVQFYICKIIGKDGAGSAENMVKGLKWAERKQVRLINLSAGIDSRKWLGLKRCEADCQVCQTAYALKGKNMLLFAAAGNNGRTVCPAKVSFYYTDSDVISVGAVNNVSGLKEKWSGEGLIYSGGTARTAGRISLDF